MVNFHLNCLEDSQASTYSYSSGSVNKDTIKKNLINTEAPWGHSFGTYAKSSEKLICLPSDTYTCMCISGGNKC